VVVRGKNRDFVNRIVEAVRGFGREKGLELPIIMHIDEVNEI